MKRTEYLNRISELLSFWSSKIRIDNAQGLFDINRLSEQLLSQLLSILYDIELEAIHTRPGERLPVVDLVDKKNKIAYEVTTRLSLNKLKIALQKIHDQNLRKTFSNGIKFFILSEDSSRVIKGDFSSIDPEFNKRRDIISFSDLIKEISLRDNKTIEKFKEVLENEIITLPKSIQIITNKVKEDVIDRLIKCEKGKDGWSEYENICIDILRLTFNKSFRNFDIRIQQRNENGIDIKDAVIPNRSEIPLWRDIRSDYGAKNIVFEFKNYTDKIGKNQLIQVSNYLKKKVYGKFAVIFSREGVSKNGEEEQKELLIHDDKMILILDDNQLIQLCRSIQPEFILEDIITDLEMKV